MSWSPAVFGILNISEDSFSDGGRYLLPAAAVAHAEKLVADGAAVLDLGAAASNPDARQISPEVEIARLAPVVATLKRKGVAISVDSFSAEVQRWALAEGVAYVNDIQGFPDAALYPTLAAASAKLIVMHSVQQRGSATRVEVSPDEIFDRILRFFERRIAAL
ncbi:MAG: dihydropteroate synthase, partial [Alphaproteobacteria bacterium]|nr:dihydropteroate synthase [Alphaproteobacteria bacterium]